MSPTDKLHGSGRQQVKEEGATFTSVPDNSAGESVCSIPVSSHMYYGSGDPGFCGGLLPGDH